MRILILFCLLIVSFQLHATKLYKETHKLDGKEITYKYTSGRSYHVKFESKGISYQYLTGSAPTKWWGAFPYTAFETYKNVYKVFR